MAPAAVAAPGERRIEGGGRGRGARSGSRPRWRAPAKRPALVSPGATQAGRLRPCPPDTPTDPGHSRPATTNRDRTPTGPATRPPGETHFFPDAVPPIKHHPLEDVDRCERRQRKGRPRGAARPRRETAIAPDIRRQSHSCEEPALRDREMPPSVPRFATRRATRGGEESRRSSVRQSRGQRSPAGPPAPTAPARSAAPSPPRSGRG